jgi:hypothetical protein
VQDKFLEFQQNMFLILLSYDQAIFVFKLIKTNQSRQSIVTFVAFITGISAIGVVKLAFAKPISTQHRRGQATNETRFFVSHKSSEPIQELVELDESFVILLRLVDWHGVQNAEA